MVRTIQQSKNDIGTGVRLLEVTTDESIRINLVLHMTAFQAEVVAISMELSYFTFILPFLYVARDVKNILVPEVAQRHFIILVIEKFLRS